MLLDPCSPLLQPLHKHVRQFHSSPHLTTMVPLLTTSDDAFGLNKTAHQNVSPFFHLLEPEIQRVAHLQYISQQIPFHHQKLNVHVIGTN